MNDLHVESTLLILTYDVELEIKYKHFQNTISSNQGAQNG